MDAFAAVPEQAEAKRLLAGALAGAGAHAFLLHGPAGVGKRTAAFALATGLLGDAHRVSARTHPDLVVVEALGEMIRIDRIRELHHDLHMRPFEAERRVYLVLDAHLLGDDAADALLKDLEEPPSYASIVLVADQLGPLPETIRSRCQLVPFHRLSDSAVAAWVSEHASDLDPEEARALARVAGGRLDRARRLLDEDARERRAALLGVARGVYAQEPVDPSAAAAVVLEAASALGAIARRREEDLVEGLDLTDREREQRIRRAERGAERDELLASLEELAAWYRDLVAVAAGADRAVLHADRLDDLRHDAAAGLGDGPASAAAAARDAWRVAEELNVNARLWLEALFVRLRRAFSGA
jgi:DNA polymerase III subunit delta'